jgi:hypothetical protein
VTCNDVLTPKFPTFWVCVGVAWGIEKDCLALKSNADSSE